jgi:flagellar hook-basal body complex protein FliE
MSPPIAALEQITSTGSATAGQSASTQQVTPFGQWFTQELDALNTQLVNADRSVQQLAAGASANLHDTMLQLEQARLSFQLAIQVRSRVLEAYQEIMRMQV